MPVGMDLDSELKKRAHVYGTGFYRRLYIQCVNEVYHEPEAADA